MNLPAQIADFAARYGKSLSVQGFPWRYYRLGEGDPILWLTGGLRRAALGFAFMQKLAQRHTVIAPDYPPAQHIAAFLGAFDAILQAEGVLAKAEPSFILGGQSYGGMLAQAYLAHLCRAGRSQVVRHLVLSSTGPADYGKAWLPLENALVALARRLPEKTVKRLFTAALLKIVPAGQPQAETWRQIIRDTIQHELTRPDIVSHFALAADLMRQGLVSPAAYQGWQGRVSVLSARNDPTQSPKDIAQYEKLFRRPVQVVDLGELGHTAALTDPQQYVALLEAALQ
jgi:pimeloyl-ACP methyl ester carboxylesterase